MESSKNDSESNIINDEEMVDVQQKKEQSAKRKTEAINTGTGSSEGFKVLNDKVQTSKVPEEAYPFFFKSACRIDPKSLIETVSLTYAKSSDEDNQSKSGDKVVKFSQVSKIADKVVLNMTTDKAFLDGAVSSKDTEVFRDGDGIFKVNEDSNQFLFKIVSKSISKNPISEGEITLAKSSNKDLHTKSEDIVTKLSLVADILNNVASVTKIIRDETDNITDSTYQCMQTIEQKKLELEQIANTIKELQLDLKPQSKIQASEPETNAISKLIKRKEKTLMGFLAQKCEQEEKLRELEAFQWQTMGEDYQMEQS